MKLNLKVLSISLAIASYSAGAQDMLKNLQREHSQKRLGVGLSVLEPTSLNLQLFGGFFCSNDDSYATYLVWEAFVGPENIVLPSDKDYLVGKWSGGGIRAGLNAHFPFLLLEPPGGTIQLYAIGGLEGGTRKYEISGVKNSSSGFGGNLGVQLNYTGRGFEMGDGLFFLSYFAGVKFHSDFSESFNYLRATAGIILRKAR